MYEFIDGAISVAGGTYVYLLAIGRIQISKDKEKADLWLSKYGKVMKIVGPLVVLFGLFRFAQVLTS